MDCRSFRKKHLAYLDDTLPAVDMAAMRRHLVECGVCAGHDTAIRRSLLVARNLPMIRPSANFTARLHARLAAERRAPAAPRFRGPGVRVFLALAASMVGVGVLTFEARARFEEPSPEALVAIAEPAAVRGQGDVGGSETRTRAPGVPESRVAQSASVADPMLMASASAGIPVWPALMLAQEAPMQFARVQFRRAAGTE